MAFKNHITAIKKKVSDWRCLKIIKPVFVFSCHSEMPFPVSEFRSSSRVSLRHGASTHQLHDNSKLHSMPTAEQETWMGWLKAGRSWAEPWAEAWESNCNNISQLVTWTPFWVRTNTSGPVHSTTTIKSATARQIRTRHLINFRPSCTSFSFFHLPLFVCKLKTEEVTQQDDSSAESSELSLRALSSFTAMQKRRTTRFLLETDSKGAFQSTSSRSCQQPWSLVSPPSVCY